MKNIFVGLVFALFTITIIFGFTACGTATEKVETQNTDSNIKNEKKDHDMSGMDHNKMDKTDHDNKDGKEHKTIDFSAYKKGETKAIASAAEQIDTALAEKNKDKAIEGAKALIAAFDKFDASKLDANKKKEYGEIAESAKEHAEHIIKSEMDHQTEHFEGLAKDLKDLFALVGETRAA